MFLYEFFYRFRNYDVASFMRGDGVDFKNRKYLEILEKDNKYLENTHDYIQVLFPIDTPSSFIMLRPLSIKEINELKKDKKIIENLCKATGIMLAFYLSTNCWLTENNHNFRRISRILRCLCLFGLRDEAKLFYSKIKPIFMKSNKISKHCKEKTLSFWDANLNV